MNSYIYDKMPARIVGCTSPSSFHNRVGGPYTESLSLWEEDYDYLLITIQPNKIYAAKDISGPIVQPISYNSPFQYIIPKNATNYPLISITGSSYYQTDANIITGGTITVNNKTITITIETSEDDYYFFDNTIQIIAYKNNI